MSEKRQILWIDDEIDLLRSHIVYLDKRGFHVTQVTNGPDAIELTKVKRFDAALVDEMMPVMDGLEVMRQLKEMRPEMPIVMVTKNEAEELMDQALGSKFDGFLTKPVNPSQILSVLKNLLQKKQISEAQLSRRWAEEFAEVSRLIDSDLDADGWLNLHSRLSTWEIDLDTSGDPDLVTMLREVRLAADRRLSRWVENEYPTWITADPDERPSLSLDVVNRWLLPLLEENEPVLFLVVDCLRFDHWLTLEPLLVDMFDIQRDSYFALLPTATPYSRNAIFSGLTPADIERVHPDLWSRGDEDEASSNRYERQFLIDQLKRRGLELHPEPKYVKVLEIDEAAEFERRINEYLQAPLTAMVYNFIDILIHTRQTVEVLKEMIPDEAAYRSVVRAWFQHSSLFRILQAYGKAGGKVLLTSDHGSIRINRGSKVIGDRETASSLRFKYGRNLKVDDRHAVKIKDPEAWGLPKRGVNIEYILGREDYYFIYPTNYNRYLTVFRDSFQHGGISLEEMVLPAVTMIGRGE